MSWTIEVIMPGQIYFDRETSFKVICCETTWSGTDWQCFKSYIIEIIICNLRFVVAMLALSDTNAVENRKNEVLCVKYYIKQNLTFCVCSKSQQVW